MDAPKCRLCGNRHYGLCAIATPAPCAEAKRSRLPPHHLAWLKAHSARSAEWLRERITDGFEVHHIDGDHANNAPDNLVLIERADHRSLHGRRLQPIIRPSQATFDRNAYQRELMRQRRAKAKP